MKIIVFDLDETLCELGKGVKDYNIPKLRELERRGNRIVICSGKPCYYLCGFLRQLGLDKPIMIGENGATIQFGVDLPPSEYYTQSYSDRARQSIKLLTDRMHEVLPDLFYQPNSVGLTPFPVSEQDFETVRRVIADSREEIGDIDVYEHCDSFDISPTGIDKGTGITRLCEILKVDIKDTVVLGDGNNDYPMFKVAGLSIGIGLKERERATLNYDSIDDALDYLLDKLN